MLVSLNVFRNPAIVYFSFTLINMNLKHVKNMYEWYHSPCRNGPGFINSYVFVPLFKICSTIINNFHVQTTHVEIYIELIKAILSLKLQLIIGNKLLMSQVCYLKYTRMLLTNIALIKLSNVKDGKIRKGLKYYVPDIDILK